MTLSDREKQLVQAKGLVDESAGFMKGLSVAIDEVRTTEGLDKIKEDLEKQSNRTARASEILEEGLL